MKNLKKILVLSIIAFIFFVVDVGYCRENRLRTKKTHGGDLAELSDEMDEMDQNQNQIDQSSTKHKNPTSLTRSDVKSQMWFGEQLSEKIKIHKENRRLREDKRKRRVGRRKNREMRMLRRKVRRKQRKIMREDKISLLEKIRNEALGMNLNNTILDGKNSLPFTLSDKLNVTAVLLGMTNRSEILRVLGNSSSMIHIIGNGTIGLGDTKNGTSTTNTTTNIREIENGTVIVEKVHELMQEMDESVTKSKGSKPRKIIGNIHKKIVLVKFLNGNKNITGGKASKWDSLFASLKGNTTISETPDNAILITKSEQIFDKSFKNKAGEKGRMKEVPPEENSIPDTVLRENLDKTPWKESVGNEPGNLNPIQDMMENVPENNGEEFTEDIDQPFFGNDNKVPENVDEYSTKLNDNVGGKYLQNFDNLNEKFGKNMHKRGHHVRRKHHGRVINKLKLPSNIVGNKLKLPSNIVENAPATVRGSESKSNPKHESQHSERRGHLPINPPGKPLTYKPSRRNFKKTKSENSRKIQGRRFPEVPLGSVNPTESPLEENSESTESDLENSGDTPEIVTESLPKKNFENLANSRPMSDNFPKNLDESVAEISTKSIVDNLPNDFSERFQKIPEKNLPENIPKNSPENVGSFPDNVDIQTKGKGNLAENEYEKPLNSENKENEVEENPSILESRLSKEEVEEKNQEIAETNPKTKISSDRISKYNPKENPEISRDLINKYTPEKNPEISTDLRNKYSPEEKPEINLKETNPEISSEVTKKYYPQRNPEITTDIRNEYNPEKKSEISTDLINENSREEKPDISLKETNPEISSDLISENNPESSPEISVDQMRESNPSKNDKISSDEVGKYNSGEKLVISPKETEIFERNPALPKT